MKDEDSIPGLVITTNATTEENTKFSNLRQGAPIKLKMVDRPEIKIEVPPGSKSMKVHEFVIRTNTRRGEHMSISES